MLKLVNLRSPLVPTLAAVAIGAAAGGGCAAGTPAGAQSRPTLVQTLDSIAGSGIKANRAPGLVAAVVRGNDTLLYKAYGKADVEWDIPMPADAMFASGLRHPGQPRAPAPAAGPPTSRRSSSSRSG